MHAPTPAKSRDLQSIAAAVADRVSYFRSATAAPASEGWHLCADLLSHPAALHELIGSTAAGRGAPDLPVAASLFVQAYAFRVPSVALGAFALGLPTPCIAPGMTAIAIARHRPAQVAYLNSQLDEPDATTLAQAIADHLGQLLAAIRSVINVGERLLWGNVAASCATAFRAIEGASVEKDRPSIRTRAEAFFQAADFGGFASAGRFETVEEGTKNGWYWTRTNCCLWYQTTSGSRCDDCSLFTPAELLAIRVAQLQGTG